MFDTRLVIQVTARVTKVKRVGNDCGKLFTRFITRLVILNERLFCGNNSGKLFTRFITRLVISFRDTQVIFTT